MIEDLMANVHELTPNQLLSRDVQQNLRIHDMETILVLTLLSITLLPQKDIGYDLLIRNVNVLLEYLVVLLDDLFARSTNIGKTTLKINSKKRKKGAVQFELRNERIAIPWRQTSRIKKEPKWCTNDSCGN